ncbi:MAG: PF20097 family protein [Candidatus Hermodarchaeota archaeon]
MTKEKQLYCPSCQKKMENGFLISSGDFYWNKAVPKLLCLGEYLASSSYLSLRCSNLSAYRCKECQIILVDYKKGSIMPSNDKK